MSKSYDLRLALKTLIVAANIGLEADDIVIARQADIFAEIETTVSRASNGVCLVISAAEKSNVAKRLDKPRWQLTLRLTLWVAPIYDQDNKPEEDISEELENLISQYDRTNGGPNKCALAYEVLSSRDLPDPDYLVRELVVQTILQN